METTKKDPTDIFRKELHCFVLIGPDAAEVTRNLFVRYTTAALLLKNGWTLGNIIGWSIGPDMKNTSRKVMEIGEPKLKIPRHFLIQVSKLVEMPTHSQQNVSIISHYICEEK